MTSNQHATEVVAAEVRAAMARQRVSGSKLAGRLGIAQQSLSARLIGRVAITIDDLADIAEALDVELSSLVAPLDSLRKSATSA